MTALLPGRGGMRGRRRWTAGKSTVEIDWLNAILRRDRRRIQLSNKSLKADIRAFVFPRASPVRALFTSAKCNRRGSWGAKRVRGQYRN
jgi:hypothetical protein